MDKSIKIDGAAEDYKIMPINPGGHHQALVLVGVSDHTKGITVRLDYIEVIHFTHDSIDLRTTVWAKTNIAQHGNIAEANSFHLLRGEYDSNDLQYISNEPKASNSQSAQAQLSSSVLSLASSANFQPNAKTKASDKTSQSDSQEESRGLFNHISDSLLEKNTRPYQSESRASQIVKDNSNSFSQGSSQGGVNSHNIHAPSNLYNSKSQTESAVTNNTLSNVDYFPKNLFGSFSNDQLRGAEGDDFFYTSDGSDFMFGYGGQDTLVGADILNIEISQIAQGIFALKGELLSISESEGGSVIYGDNISTGDILFTSIEFFKQRENDVAIPLAMLQSASEFDDSLVVRDSSEAWQVNGLAGNDSLRGGDHGDLIDGGLGNDIIDSGNNSLASNGSFYEVLSGGEGRDNIIYHGFYGDVTTNSIEANLFGGLGNDFIGVNLDGISQVRVSGGEGLDILSLDGAGQNIWNPIFYLWGFILSDGNYLLQGLSQNDHQGAGVYETDPTIEKVSLGLSNSGQTFNLIRPDLQDELNISGTNSDDLLIGIHGKENQILDAGNGNDVVVISENSTVSLGSGINQLFSTSNDYTLSYDWSSKAVRVDLASQLGMIFDDSGDFVALDRFNLSPNEIKGSSSGDMISGDENPNSFYGGDGNDQIIGGGGNDFIYGGDGNDIITASGLGYSTLEGGLGSDQFILNYDFIAGSYANIKDFNINQGDKFLVNLNALQLSNHFGLFEIFDNQGNSLLSDIIENETSSDILNLMIDRENNTLNFVDSFNNLTYTVVDMEAFSGDLTSDQWATVINIGYI
jgi:Ca2+-binding RTX toxin-like protein